MSKSMQFKAIIKKQALQDHIPAQAVLQNYMLERLLERISLSKYKDMIVLKGGMLIASMVGMKSRTIREIYCQENYYAKDIKFDKVIDVLINIEI